jgi:hypothetical protein
VLGRYVELAEREERIGQVPFDPEYKVTTAADIGYRDTCAFWFWQVTPNGINAIRNTEASGLDAGEWVQKLKDMKREHGYRYDTIWLPHDSRAKTFAARDTAVDVFRRSGLGVVRITPRSSKSDYINAARLLLRECHIDKTNCERGLAAMRDWTFKWDEERKIRSSEPEHGWSSHSGEGFCYSALVLAPFVKKKPVKTRAIAKPMSESYTLKNLFEDRDNANTSW